MNDAVVIITLAEPKRWLTAQQDGGLPSQSWSYARGLSASGVEPKLAVVRAGGARMLLPFFARQWAETTDIATTLGASGASITPWSPAPLRLWREFAAEQGWVAGYIRLALGADLDPDAVAGEIAEVNAAFLLPLQADDPLRGAAHTIRAKIGAAEKSGAVAIYDRARLAEALGHLYPPAMRRAGAGSHYAFSRQTLDHWAHDRESVLMGAALGGCVEIVCLFRILGRHAEWHLSASTERGRSLAPWVIWRSLPRLREKGASVLNLGGGLRPGDGLYRFKQRFHGVAMPVRAVRQVYDQDAYARLCAAAGVGDAGDWFPAYRARAEQSGPSPIG